MPTPSAVTIANEALAKVGGARITALDQTGDAALLVRQFIDQARQHVLSQHPWGCSLKRATLALSASSPAWGWDYQFALPADCIVVWDLLENHKTQGGWLWTVEGRYLLTNVNTAHILYGCDTEVYPHMLPQLRTVIAAKLAHMIAPKLRTKKSVRDAAWDDYVKGMQLATAEDSRVSGPARYLVAGEADYAIDPSKSWVQEM